MLRLQPATTVSGIHGRGHEHDERAGAALVHIDHFSYDSHDLSKSNCSWTDPIMSFRGLITHRPEHVENCSNSGSARDPP